MRVNVSVIISMSHVLYAASAISLQSGGGRNAETPRACFKAIYRPAYRMYTCGRMWCVRSESIKLIY